MAKLMIIFFALVGVLGLTESACPSGWRQHAGRCYYFSPRYRATTWASGKAQCEAMGATYVAITNSNQMNFIQSNTDWGWTGGTDRYQEGNFIWDVRPRQAIQYTNWAPGEPNGGSSEDCVELRNDGTWNDASCSNHRIAICEKGGSGGSATSVRLVGGSNPREGRVEVSQGGYTGTICDDGWDDNDARVICRMLGYGNVGTAHSRAHHGQGSGQIMMDDVGCSGSERNIADCSHSGWRTHNCGHHEDASVSCRQVAVNGGWSGWGSWRGCSRNCGGGTSYRYRSCNNPTPSGGGSYCSGSSSIARSCNTHSCARHGGWSAYGSWGGCSRTCGGGTRNRYRSCTNPTPAYGGNQCSGDRSQSVRCNTQNCPRHGNWGRWASWSACSVTCESGSRSRQRQCNNPAPAYGGNQCSGNSQETSSCSVSTRCPIHGRWGSWRAWSTCTAECESSGTRTRTRSCDNPRPQYGGQTCPNSNSHTESCRNEMECDNPDRCDLTRENFLRDPHNPKKFYQCDRNGETRIYHRNCAPGTQWPAQNPSAQACEHLPTTTTTTTGATCSKWGSTYKKHPSVAGKFYQVDASGTDHLMSCPAGLVFKLSPGCRCDWP